jgi:hypothetical protein
MSLKGDQPVRREPDSYLWLLHDNLLLFFYPCDGTPTAGDGCNLAMGPTFPWLPPEECVVQPPWSCMQPLWESY